MDSADIKFPWRDYSTDYRVCVCVIILENYVVLFALDGPLLENVGFHSWKK